MANSAVELRLNLRATTCRAAVATLVTVVAILSLASGVGAQSAPPQFVYTTDPQSHLIYGFQLNPTTGALTGVSGSPFDERLSPAAMAVNPAATFLFVANGNGFNNVSVFSINTTSGALTEIANSPFSTGLGVSPVSVSTDANGKFLYVGNTTGSSGGLANSGEIDAYSINQTTGELTPTPNSTAPFVGTQSPLNPSSVYAHPNGRWIYFQGGYYSVNVDNLVQGYVIDPATGDLANTIPVYQGTSSSRFLEGDPAGKFLINEYGPTCVYIEGLGISATDGSLTPISTFISPGTGICGIDGNMAIDYTGNYLYSGLGSFSVTGGNVMPDQIAALDALPSGPWTADPLGPFLFGGDTEYMIDETNGTLTTLPGFNGGSNGGTIAVVTGYPPQTPTPGAGFSPAGLTFSNASVGVSSAPQTIELVNTGTSTLNISGISISGTNAADFAQTNACAATLNAGANCAISVAFTPSTTAAEAASLSVSDNAAGSPHLASLTGTGLPVTPPFAQLSSNSISFPMTNLGSTNSQSFTITNTGTQTLTISTVTIGGSNTGDFTETNNCVRNIAGSAMCMVTVVFQPQAVGQRTATVMMTGNVGIGSVALTGVAANPFTVAPSGSTTATVPPGQAATYGLSFTPAAAFSGTVTFSCSVVPAGPSCTVSPMMVQVAASNNPAATPVTVTATTPSTGGAVRVAGFDRGVNIFGTGRLKLPAISGLAALAMALYWWLGFKKNSSNAFASATRRRIAGLVIAVAMVTLIAACGGGGSSTTPPQPQTFAVKVTAAAGASTQTVNFALNVQ